MPELPEVEALSRFLGEQLVGRTISRVDVAAISALKTFDPPIDALRGRTITGTGRRGKHVLIHADPVWLVIHLARGGWIKWVEQFNPKPLKPGRGPLALRVRLEGGDGIDVTEAGTEKRLAVWLANDPDDIENVATLGPDPLTDAFDVAALHAALNAAGNTQIKGALTDQRLIAGVGNAYSDEALHMAKLSPFKQSAKLNDDEVSRLYDAVVTVLRDAVDRSLGLPAKGLKSEKKEGLRVHGKAGQPCPVCGDTIRDVHFASKSLQYCATCQTGGKPLADRRLSRLLK
ncbi:MAG TPA: DNA-formamidopyrimidine glycosylase family protein [Acidimicrobiales bacterium]|nr:DNA-formamidopyrimidine glycosylase family protein [Acidimicrobiales bacterium]